MNILWVCVCVCVCLVCLFKQKTEQEYFADVYLIFGEFSTRDRFGESERLYAIDWVESLLILSILRNHVLFGIAKFVHAILLKYQIRRFWLRYVLRFVNIYILYISEANTNICFMLRRTNNDISCFPIKRMLLGFRHVYKDTKLVVKTQFFIFYSLSRYAKHLVAFFTLRPCCAFFFSLKLFCAFRFACVTAEKVLNVS